MPSVDSFVEFLAIELLNEASIPLGLLIDAPADGERLWLAGPVSAKGEEGLVSGKSLVEVLNKISQQWGFTAKDLDIKDSRSRVLDLAHLTTHAGGAIKIFAPASNKRWVVETEAPSRTFFADSMHEALFLAGGGISE